MATSTIKTGLRLAKLDSSHFSWSDSGKCFAYNYASAVAETGLNTIVTWFATSEMPSGAIFGVNVNTANTIRVLGWAPKTGTNITSDYATDSFSVYAIGY